MRRTVRNPRATPFDRRRAAAMLAQSTAAALVILDCSERWERRNEILRSKGM
jgi:hypothetical protein